MTLLLGALTIGLILSLLAFGVYVSFRLFDVADISVDGTFTLGAAVVAVKLAAGWNPSRPRWPPRWRQAPRASSLAGCKPNAASTPCSRASW